MHGKDGRKGGEIEVEDGKNYLNKRHQENTNTITSYKLEVERDKATNYRGILQIFL